MPALPLQKIVQNRAYGVVGWQLFGVFLIALFAWLITDQKTGLGVLAGGLAYGLPNLIFVWRVFRYAGAQQMNRFITAFIFGELIKLLFSGFLFILVVKTWPFSLLSVLVGFAGAILSFWVVCMWQFSKQGI
jgi:ATP synthase protein I